ncbi:MAG: adenylate cyclase [Butyrivibrio sp.]|nr:adenylate cyclase [Butyrivibrio sp.]
MEIERKFTVKELPDNLDSCPFHRIEQAYLNVRPAIRVRREDDIYYMTYKASRQESEPALMNGEPSPIGQTEYNMPLDAGSYEHMAAKADGNVIRKKRYILPLNEGAFSDEFLLSEEGLKAAIENNEIKIELDVFEAPFDGRILAEVEFPSEAAANNYRPADWFDKDVTGDPGYSNSQMSIEKLF